MSAESSATSTPASYGVADSDARTILARLRGARFRLWTDLDATIKEVLRLRPVIPAVGRKLSAPMTIAGYAMPAGTLVVPECYLTHRLPAYYPDPRSFRPERFLDRKPDPYAWFPFGGGARRCLGMAFAIFELKVVLATVLRTVRLRKTSSSPARVSLRGFTLVPGAGSDVVVDLSERRARSTPATQVTGDPASATAP